MNETKEHCLKCRGEGFTHMESAPHFETCPCDAGLRFHNAWMDNLHVVARIANPDAFREAEPMEPEWPKWFQDKDGDLYRFESDPENGGRLCRATGYDGFGGCTWGIEEITKGGLEAKQITRTAAERLIAEAKAKSATAQEPSAWPYPFSKEEGYVYILTDDDREKHAPQQQGDEYWSGNKEWVITLLPFKNFSTNDLYRRRLSVAQPATPTRPTPEPAQAVAGERSLGQVAYEAYPNFIEKQWDQIHPEYKENWEIRTQAVRDEIVRRMPKFEAVLKDSASDYHVLNHLGVDKMWIADFFYNAAIAAIKEVK